MSDKGFREGDRVTKPGFGIGTVFAVSPSGLVGVEWPTLPGESIAEILSEHQLTRVRTAPTPIAELRALAADAKRIRDNYQTNLFGDNDGE